MPKPATAFPSRARRSSTSPTASSSACSSTTSRSTCATASCARTTASSTSARARSRGRAEWTSPAGRTVRVTSVRLVSFTQRAIVGDRLRGRAARRAGQRRRAVGAGGQRAAADGRAATRAPRRRSSRRSRRRTSVLRAARRPCSSTGPSGAACASRRRWTTSSRARRASTSRRRRRPTPPASRSRTCSSREQRLRLIKLVAYGWSQRSHGARDARPGRGGPRGRRLDRLGGAPRRPAAVPRRLLGAGRRRARGRCRAAAGGPLRALPRAAGRRARGAPRHPRQGSDRHGLRRPFVLGHRDVHPAGAHPHRPGGRRRRAALAPRDARRSREQRARDLGLAGAAFPWRTIHGEECSGYWPAGTAAFHVNADIADAVLRYVDATGDEPVRARRRRRHPRRDRAAVARPRAPRRAAAPFASTASPGPTSTAPSPTTTSTRT